MSTAHIKVYAFLPGTATDFHAETNWHWVHCLTLPLDMLNALRFSQRPYKWICYAIGVVIGAKGILSTSSNSLNAVAVDDDAVPAESVDLYYHTTLEERRRMFPIDPTGGRTHVTSSVSIRRRNDFRDDVAERDGRRCLLTGVEEIFCDAVHVLPHSKGDEVCYSYFQPILAYHHNHSTFRLILTTAVETRLEMTL